MRRSMFRSGRNSEENLEIASPGLAELRISVDGAYFLFCGAPQNRKGIDSLARLLRPDVATALKQWLSQQNGKPEDPLFPSSKGGRLSADALQQLVLRHIATARQRCPSLASKTVTPHTLRHGAAMALLHRGVDL